MSAWMKRAKRVPSPPRTLKLPPWVWIRWLPSSNSCYTRICVDCSNGYKMDPPASDRTPTIQNGNNLTLEKNRQGWHESLSKRQSGVRKHSLTLYDLSYSLNFKAVVFYLHEVTWTFLNTKTCTYKKDNKPRSLYVYSSLCNPVMVGRPDHRLIETSPVSTAPDRNIFVRRSHHSTRKIT